MVTPTRTAHPDHVATPVLRPLLKTWSWQSRGRCRDSDLELFFPPDGLARTERHRREQAAKEICGRCPVAAQCLRHAIDGAEQFGVWGGMTFRERQRMAR